jgi:hypothetical protein
VDLDTSAATFNTYLQFKCFQRIHEKQHTLLGSFLQLVRMLSSNTCDKMYGLRGLIPETLSGLDFD